MVSGHVSSEHGGPGRNVLTHELFGSGCRTALDRLGDEKMLLGGVHRLGLARRSIGQPSADLGAVRDCSSHLDKHRVSTALNYCGMKLVAEPSQRLEVRCLAPALCAHPVADASQGARMYPLCRKPGGHPLQCFPCLVKTQHVLRGEDPDCRSAPRHISTRPWRSRRISRLPNGHPAHRVLLGHAPFGDWHCRLVATAHDVVSSRRRPGRS